MTSAGKLATEVKADAAPVVLESPVKGFTGSATWRQKRTLSKRDVRIFFLVTAGLTLSEISDFTGINYRAVRDSLRRIIKYFGLGHLGRPAALARLYYLRWKGHLPAVFFGFGGSGSVLSAIEDHLEKFDEYVQKLKELTEYTS